MVDNISSGPEAAPHIDSYLPRTTSLGHRRLLTSRTNSEGVLRARPKITPPEDSFVSPAPLSSPSRLSHFTRPHFSSRRQRRRVDVPESMRNDTFKAASLDIETYEADDGSVEVVDCAFIASRKELRRWRLGLTDFHALLTGGKEAIEAYRTEQKRKDEERRAAAKHDHDVQDILDADAHLEAELLRDGTLDAQKAQEAQSPVKPICSATAQNTMEPHQALPHRAPAKEPLWRTIVMWPLRAVMRLWSWTTNLLRG